MPAPLSHIYCIDDEENILEITAMCLREVGGFRITVFNRAQDALNTAAAAATADKPDLVLVDVTMPLLDGPATLRAFRENPDIAAIPFIFVTARVQPSEIEKYRNYGAIGIISKPYDPMTLGTQILQIWNSRT